MMQEDPTNILCRRLVCLGIKHNTIMHWQLLSNPLCQDDNNKNLYRTKLHRKILPKCQCFRHGPINTNSTFHHLPSCLQKRCNLQLAHHSMQEDFTQTYRSAWMFTTKYLEHCVWYQRKMEATSDTHIWMQVEAWWWSTNCTALPPKRPVAT